MSKSDLQARPIYHHQRDSIEAHLTIVFTALAISRWIENQPGGPIRKFVRTARRYRTIEIQAGPHTITAADPLRTTCASPRPDPRALRCALTCHESGVRRARTPKGASAVVSEDWMHVYEDYDEFADDGAP